MISSENKLYTEIISLSCTHNTDKFCSSVCLLKFLKPWVDKNSLFEKWLHPKELAYLNCLKYAQRQESYALGRLAAKQALHAYFPAHDVRAFFLEPGVFNQPILFGEGLAGMQVSISHKKDFAASLVCSQKHPMAIDIEKIAPEQRAAVFNILTSKEKELFFPAGDLIFEGDFYSLVWSAKESLGKVLKTGLAVSMEVLEISSIENIGQNLFLSSYAHFPQYKSLSFIWQDLTVSIALPKKSYVHWQ